MSAGFRFGSSICQRLAQIFFVCRLTQNYMNTEFASKTPINAAGIRGDHNGRQMQTGLAETPDDLNSSSRRHPIIAEEDINQIVLDHSFDLRELIASERFPTIRRRDPFKRSADTRFIVDDE